MASSKRRNWTKQNSLRVAATVILIGLAGADTVRAQDAKKPRKRSLSREMKLFEKEIDKKKRDCTLCDGKGWNKKLSGTREECWQCEGQKRTLPGRDYLAAYIAYLDFREQHAEELAEKAERKFVKEFHKRHSVYLLTIKRSSGAVGATLTREWPEGSGIYVRGHGAYDYGFTVYALEVILDKNEPVGRPLAFKGVVLSTTDADGRTIAKVVVESVEHPGVTCFVIVPKGVRWAARSEVFVIGTAVGTDEDTIIVSPYPGTE